MSEPQLHADWTTQHESPTTDAGRGAAGYVQMALVAAQRLVALRAGRLDRRADADWAPADQAAAAPDSAAQRQQARKPMLDRSKGRHTDTATALAAWVAAQPDLDSDPQARLAAGRAEDRLRVLHPDAMDRYEALRADLGPEQAMREIAPLLTAEADGRPAAEAAAGQVAAETSSAPDRAASAGDVPAPVADAVRQALPAELATAVLADQSWPELQQALVQVQQAGGEPARLLEDVAAQRELSSASHPAMVLHHRIEQTSSTTPPQDAAVVQPARTPTAADVAATSYPTRLPASAARSGPDLVLLAAAAGLAHEADAQLATAHRAADTPDDLSTPTVDEHAVGVQDAGQHTGLAAVTTDRSAAASSTALANPAASVAQQHYPVPLNQAGPAVAASSPSPAAAAPRPRAAAASPPAARRR